MQGIIKSKTVTLSTPPGVGQVAQMPGEQDTLSLARGDLQASGHSWQQRSLCLFLSPLALGVTAANERTCIPLETVLELGINHLAGEGAGWRLEGEQVKRRGEKGHPSSAVPKPPQNRTLHPLLS